jgi:uncharacterized protein
VSHGSNIDLQARPLPAPDADSAAYWQGLRQGRLLLQHCRDCGHVQVYQQGLCRQCLSDQLEHRAASGHATVHAWSVVHRAPGPAFRGDVPYAVLLVTLAEGPRMISALTQGDPHAVHDGMAVELVCEAVEGGVVLPKFRPLA